jgi:hypothetical protein
MPRIAGMAARVGGWGVGSACIAPRTSATGRSGFAFYTADASITASGRSLTAIRLAKASGSSRELACGGTRVAPLTRGFLVLEQTRRLPLRFRLAAATTARRQRRSLHSSFETPFRRAVHCAAPAVCEGRLGLSPELATPRPRDAPTELARRTPAVDDGLHRLVMIRVVGGQVRQPRSWATYSRPHSTHLSRSA